MCRRASFLLASLLLLGTPSARAESSFDPAHSRIDSPFGPLEWRPDSQNGASINQFYCLGYIHGATVGWIRLGAGTPQNRAQYQNNSAADFGVNVSRSGALRGFAYGANIGWIAFEETGNPRVDWASGKLSGAAWSANLGWIQLENGAQTLRLAYLGDSADSDRDGLPDAWEMSEAGSLTRLAKDGDADGDGLADFGEYLAGTKPLDPADLFGPLVLAESAVQSSRTLEWPSKSGYLYQIDFRPALHPTEHWTPLGSALTGTGQALRVPLLDSAARSAFFRVRASPPLARPR